MKTESKAHYSNSSARLPDMCAALLITLFCYAAFSKLLDFGQFREQLLNQTIPAEVARVLVYVLPTAEILTVSLLLIPATRWLGLFASALLMLAFTAYIALVWFGFWDRVPCSCGGVLNGMGWGAHLVFNLFFLAIALYALIHKTKTGQAENLRKE
jgi:hypothetical protein